MLIPLAEWARAHGKTPQAARNQIYRRKLIVDTWSKNKIETKDQPLIRKSGREWFIDDSVEWPGDERLKTSEKPYK